MIMSETAQSLQVYPAPMMPVSGGANFGDNLSFAADLMLDDYYQLAAGAAPPSPWSTRAGKWTLPH